MPTINKTASVVPQTVVALKGFSRVLKAGLGNAGCPREKKVMQHVAKTIGFTTFSKTKLLWQPFEGSPMHGAAATATFVSKML